VGRKATLLLLGAMIACLGVFAFSSQAKAAPVSMELESGKLNLGFAFQNADILPAPSSLQTSPPPAPATPLPDLWDARETTTTVNPASALPAGCLTPARLNLTVNPPTPVGPNNEAPCNPNPAAATVTGDLTGSTVTIPGSPDTGLGAVPGANPSTSWGMPSGFRFPIMVVANPLDGSPVPVSIASTGDLTGTFNSSTGALSLSGPIEARVLTGLASNPLGSYCALPLTGLTLSTEDNADFDGAPFVNGFGGGGTLTGTYNITDDATSVGGADCGTVNSVSKGLGSIQVTSSSDGPVSMNLDYGKLNLGFAFQGADILPAPSSLQTSPPPAPATPLPDLWDARDTTDISNPNAALPAGCLTPALLDITTNPPTPVGPNPEAPCNPNPAEATVSGALAGTTLTVNSSPDNGVSNKYGLPSGFRFPVMVVANPLDGSPVPVSIAATGDLTGSYDVGTGDISLSGPIEARVLTGLATNPLGSYCALPLTGLTLSTTGNADFGAVPFTSGFGGPGALTGTYNITDDATSVGGADCGTVNSVSKGQGSIWVSNSIAEPPVCPENTQGSPPNCEPIPCPEFQTGNVPDCQPIPCPAGFRGNQPNCVRLKARISRVTISGPSRGRVGQVKVFKVRVTNNGNAQATGVRLVTTGRGVRVNSPIRVINPGKTRLVRLRVRLRFPGKLVLRASVRTNNAGSRGARKVVRIRR
jgi:hypothetical protein